MRILVSILLSTIFIMIGARVFAQHRVPAEVLIVLAKEKSGKIDPQLKAEEALNRSPWNSFRSMQVLSLHKLSLPIGKDTSLSLPNGRQVDIHLLRVLPNHQYLIQTSIRKSKKTTPLPLLKVAACADKPFFIAGQDYQAGILLVGITVNPHKTIKE